MIGPGPGRARTARRLDPVDVGPIPLDDGELVLRRPRYDDFAEWREVRLRNERAVRRFWPTTTESWDALHTEWRWLQEVANHRDAARAGTGVAFVLEVDGRLAGQVNLTGLDPVARTAELGVWADRELARRHVALAAVCAAFDLALTHLDLVRVTAPGDTRNRPALALAHHIGMTKEATMRGYSHVDGAWRDHHLMTVVTDDRPARGFLADRLGRGDLDWPGLVRPGRTLDSWPASWGGRGDLAKHRLRGVRARLGRRGAPSAGEGDDGVRDHDRAHRIVEVHVDGSASPDSTLAGVRRVTAHAFGTLGAHRVTALASPDDDLRATAYAAAGLRHEGTLRSVLRPDGSHGEMDLWAVLVDDPRP